MPTEPAKTDPPKRERRWYQFSLRTLMIGVTLLAVASWWVAAQKKLVEDRKEMLTKIEKIYGSYWSFEQLPPGKASAISGLRHLLGDRAVVMIALPLEADAKMYPLIHSLFPEALLSIVDPNAIDRRFVDH